MGVVEVEEAVESSYFDGLRDWNLCGRWLALEVGEVDL